MILYFHTKIDLSFYFIMKTKSLKSKHGPFINKIFFEQFQMVYEAILFGRKNKQKL